MNKYHYSRMIAILRYCDNKAMKKRQNFMIKLESVE